MEKKGQFLYHTGCPKCGSSDARAVYDTGSSYCFSCKTYYPADDMAAADVRRQKPTDLDWKPLTGTYKPLKKRGISQETCEKFGYLTGTDKKGQPVQIANYRDSAGNLIGQKIRTQDKQFRTLGRPQDALFGMHLWNGGRKIVITEGEIDALSVSEAQGNKWPVVSVPTGAGGAAKALSKHLDYLERFEEIILLFDNDEAGEEGAQEAALVLPAGKTYIARLPGQYKDANEALLAEDIRAITAAIWNAKAYKPDGLLTIDDIIDDILKPPEQGIPWFLPTLTQLTYGRRPGELYFLGAGTGVGKTDWMVQSIAYDIFELGEEVAVFFLEQPPNETVKRIIGKYKGVPYHIPLEDEQAQQARMEELKIALQHPAIQSLNLYNAFGVADWDSIKLKILYLASQGCRIVYIDHLTALATGVEEKDERKELERITADMASLAKQHNLIITCVSHLATPDKGSHEEGARVKIRHFKGSRAIGFWAYFMFGLERDQQAEDEDARHTSTLRILKDRYTGQSTGRTIQLAYDPETTRISEKGTGFQAVDVDDEEF